MTPHADSSAPATAHIRTERTSHMRFFGKTDVGMVRKINQDSFDCRTVWGKEATLLVVCDGMGGHRAGEIASKKAVTSFVDKVVSFPCLSDEQFEQFSEIRHTLIVAAKTANNLLFRMSRDFDELSGMGTTLVAGLIYNNMLYVVNIGDSRLYIIPSCRSSCPGSRKSWSSRESSRCRHSWPCGTWALGGPP